MPGDVMQAARRWFPRPRPAPRDRREAPAAAVVAVVALAAAAATCPTDQWQGPASAVAAAIAGGGAGITFAGRLHRRCRRTQESTGAKASDLRLLAAASHDLRQPLQTLYLLAAALEARPCACGRDRIAGRMAGIIGGLDRLMVALLELARLEAGDRLPPVQVVALDECFTALENEFGPLFAHKGLRLRRVPTSVHVRTNPVLMTNILRNLFANALRYTETGGAVIGARRRGDEVLIQVVDTGRGIARQDQERIFDVYQRAASGVGEGLGLAIVRRIAGLLGHRVVVRSRLGRGSSFGVVVPSVPPPPHP